MLPPLLWLHDPVVDGYQGKWHRSTELGDAIGGTMQGKTIQEEAKHKLDQVWQCVQMNHVRNFSLFWTILFLLLTDL